MSLEITTIEERNAECDDFIQRAAGARLCHTYAWTRMVEDTFGYKGHYLIARQNGQICGVLPLIHVRSRLFGNRLLSMPFSDYGGPVTTSAAATEALYHRAIAIAEEHGCDSVELRNTIPLSHDLYLRRDKMSMYLPLAPNAQEVWETLRHKTRNRVRKAERSGLTVKVGGQEFIGEFYRVWTVRMRELGTPCYPCKLFHTIMRMFPDQSRIFVAVLAGAPVAVLFAYTFKGWVQCSWGAALRAYDGLGPNYILNWAAIEYYCGQSMRWFDFGRSTKGSGQHTFKERWGAHPIELCWQYWTPPGGRLALATPTSDRYRNKVELWKRMPLWATRLIGPVISPALA